MTSRVERRRERTAEILDAATTIIVDEGPEALTMQRLAKQVDAAVGALYRYFDGKDSLFVALQRRAVEAFAEDLDAEMARAPSRARDPKVRALIPILRVARLWRDQSEAAPARHRLIDAFISDPHTLLSQEQAVEVEGALAPVLQVVSGAFAGAAEASALEEGDASVRTHVLWACVHGLDHFKKRDYRVPDKLRSDLLFEETIRALLRGFGGEASVVDRAVKAALR
jgi:AcrR family transcriptional regulator